MLDLEIKPLYDRVLVQMIKTEETKTTGGVIIPQKGYERPVEGIVLACGPGIFREDGTLKPMHVQINDRVLINPATLKEIRVRQKVFGIVREVDILAVLSLVEKDVVTKEDGLNTQNEKE